MAACGSLQHIFEKPLPENPTLFESLSSWKNQINPIVEQSSFTEIFGELHFKDIDSNTTHELNLETTTNGKVDDAVGDEAKEEEKSPLYKKKKIGGGGGGGSFMPMNYESLQLCTEGLGFESSDDVDVDVDMKHSSIQVLLINKEGKCQEEEGERKDEKEVIRGRPVARVDRNGDVVSGVGEFRRSRGFTGGGERGFPPPISCIGKSGKPWVHFKSYREGGRFVLKEVRVPTQEFLHASREDGRLKLKFVQPDDEEEEEEEEDEEEAEEEGEGNENEEKGREDGVEEQRNCDW